VGPELRPVGTWDESFAVECEAKESARIIKKSACKIPRNAGTHCVAAAPLPTFGSDHIALAEEEVFKGASPFATAVRSRHFRKGLTYLDIGGKGSIQYNTTNISS
jgi:hypothetical protein